MGRDIARAIEKLLFPSNTIMIGAVLLLIYLTGESVFVNNVLTFLSSLLVYGLVIYLFKGRIRDENKLYCIGSLSALLAFFLCYYFLNLSKEIVFGAISLLLVTLIIYTVRPRWKISGHTTALMGVWTTLLLVDLIFLPLGMLSPLVIWSRLKLKAHTPTQIIAGAMVGLLVPLILHYFM
ncbi:MAG: hypothetical protein ACE5OW_01570 [Candidatus Bathyarchaeia archaeon]